MTDRSMDGRYQLRGGERWRDPWADYRRLRDEAPVLRVDHEQYGEFWVLSRFDDVFEAVRDAGTFSSAQGLTPDAASMAMFEGRATPIVMMDPPEHTIIAPAGEPADDAPAGGHDRIGYPGVRRRTARRRGGGR